MIKNVLKIIGFFLLPLLLGSCLTTAAILKNKTIITHQGTPMPVTGINWGFPKKGREIYPMFEEMGITWLRTDFSWDKLEPEQGTWDFTHTDYFCEEATSNGYKIIGVLSFGNDWILDEPEGKREIPLDQIDHFLNYVTTVVERYGDYVDEWEIWNEPNVIFNVFWTGTDKDFYEFTRLVAAHIRKIDPTAVIIGGSHWRYNKSYVKDMFEWGSLDQIDAFSYHPYYDKPEKIYDKSRDLEDDLTAMGFEGDYRITEVGFNTYGRMPTSCKPEEQGRMVMETLALLGDMKLPYIIWYTLYNNRVDAKGLWNDQYGVLIKDGNEFEYKTGGWALRRYNELIAGKYKSKTKINLDESLENKVLPFLYYNGLDNTQQTLLLMGEKKEIDLVLDGYETGTLYNCATGEIIQVSAPYEFVLRENDPLLLTLNYAIGISIKEK